MTISRHYVISLLTRFNCNNFGVHLDNDIWTTKDNLIIRLPKNGAIPYALVEIICIEILDMGTWEYDYWLGEINFKIQ